MKKILVTSIIIGIVLIVGIATLILGLIPVNMNDKITTPNEIYVYSASTNYLANKRLEYRARSEKDSVKLNRIYYLFNQSFQQKALKALFSGELGKGLEIKHTAVSENMSKNYTNEENITVVFYYKDGIKIECEGYELTYNYAFIELTNTDERQDFVIGLSDYLSSDDDDIAYVTYRFSFHGKANVKQLYDYVFSLI